MPSYEELYSRLGVSFVSRSGRESSARCPFHKDDSPSFSVNMDSGLFKCHAGGCGVGGDFRIFTDMAAERLDKFLAIPPAVIQEAHQRLLSDPDAMNWLLSARGLSRQTAIQFELGLEEDKSRLWIPVKVGDKYFNVRRHRRDKDLKGPKTYNYEKGYGYARLWPSDPISQEIWICEGELDCMVLRQMGLESVTGTGGADTWKEEWNEKFKGKDVIIVYDVDEAGRAGADGVSNNLTGVAKSVRVVTLNFRDSGKDVTDYMVKDRRTLGDLRQLADGQQNLSRIPGVEERPVKSLSLAEARKQENVGSSVRVPVVVAGKDLAPFAVPAKAEFKCKGGLKICPACSIQQKGGTLKAEIKNDDPRLLTLLNVNAEAQRLAVRKIVGINPTCGRFEWTVQEYHGIEEVKLLPDIEYIGEANSEYTIAQAYTVGMVPGSNQSYEAEGKVIPHPQTQYVTFLFPKMTPRKNALETYQPSKESLEDLATFQASSGNAMEKLRDIAEDLTANVTKIYCRQDVIMAFDLVAHSALSFDFNGSPCKRGWTQGLVVGDTRCGKSETAEKLVKHYRAGEIITTENTSYAGLVGGLQQTNKKWMLTWGKYPLNDRKMLVLDEVSGLSTEDIEKMSGVRSSGIAEITKIQTERAQARVRSLWLSNPRSANPVNSHDSGVHVVKHLIGKPEDIARFDFAQVIAVDDVPLEVVNAARQSKSSLPHRYTSKLCHELILWCWSRERGQIVFEDAAVEACLDQASKFAKIYSPSLPIVEPNEQRIKFARLGAAIAGRLFSTEDGENLLVKAEHVEVAAMMLDKWFKNQNFNYHVWSNTKISEIEFAPDVKAELKDALLPLGYNFCQKLLNTSWIKVGDLEDWSGLDRAAVKVFIHKISVHNAIKRSKDAYVKAPGFIRLLKEIKREEVEVAKKEEVAF